RWKQFPRNPKLFQILSDRGIVRLNTVASNVLLQKVGKFEEISFEEWIVPIQNIRRFELKRNGFSVGAGAEGCDADFGKSRSVDVSGIFLVRQGNDVTALLPFAPVWTFDVV